MLPDLLPCPSCGARPLVQDAQHRAGWVAIDCSTSDSMEGGCEGPANSPAYLPEAEAYAGWNERADRAEAERDALLADRAPLVDASEILD